MFVSDGEILRFAQNDSKMDVNSHNAVIITFGDRGLINGISRGFFASLSVGVPGTE